MKECEHIRVRLIKVFLRMGDMSLCDVICVNCRQKLTLYEFLGNKIISPNGVYKRDKQKYNTEEL